MISFLKLGQRSRLGNHLFQYAFIRSQAKRLGVKFYCPHWSGDDFFDLRDDQERVAHCAKIDKTYSESIDYTGFSEEMIRQGDDTDYYGYFQTEKYFSTDARKWFALKPSLIEGIERKYEGCDFNQGVGISVRLGDFLDDYYRRTFYVPRINYYKNALQHVARHNKVFVFSDDIAAAKMFFKDLDGDLVFMDGYTPHEGLYLQSKCRDFICSPSTYSWWGAWLNAAPEKIIVAPKEGPFRPGAKVANQDFWPEDWVTIPALRVGLDHFQAESLRVLSKRVKRKLLKALATNH